MKFSILNAEKILCILHGHVFVMIMCNMCITTLIMFSRTGLGSSVGRVSAPRSGGTGFDPGP